MNAKDESLKTKTLHTNEFYWCQYINLLLFFFFSFFLLSLMFSSQSVAMSMCVGVFVSGNRWKQVNGPGRTNWSYLIGQKDKAKTLKPHRSSQNSSFPPLHPQDWARDLMENLWFYLAERVMKTANPVLVSLGVFWVLNFFLAPLKILWDWNFSHFILFILSLYYLKKNGDFSFKKFHREESRKETHTCCIQPPIDGHNSSSML